MGECTDFLFARPSFTEGVGRLLDFGGTLTQFNASPTEEVADLVALRSDVAVVAQDFQKVLEQTPPASLVGNCSVG